MPYGLKIDKKIKYLLVSLAAFLPFFACRAQNVVYTTEAEIAHKALTESHLRSYVEFLSDSVCAGRATGTPGGNVATFWLVSRFQSCGLQPVGGSYVRHFTTETRKTGRNVIGLLPGSRPDADYVILAAHYDGLGTLDGKMYPGADSNASGIAALFGVSDMMRTLQELLGKKYRRNLLFVALDGKNANLSGSRALWEDIEAGRLTDPVTGKAVTPDRISVFVNIDQVGSTLSPLHDDRPDFLIMLPGVRPMYGNYLTACNLRYDVGLDLGFDYYGSRDFTRLFYERISDQKVFLEHRIPAVMFTSGITLNNNKVHDTPDTLDYAVLRRRVWLIFHWLERIL